MFLRGIVRRYVWARRQPIQRCISAVRRYHSAAAVAETTINRLHHEGKQDGHQPEDAGALRVRRVRVRKGGTPRSADKSLSFSPTRVLAMRRNLRVANSRLTRKRWELSREIAKSRSLRLPVITAQLILRRHEAQMRTELSSYLSHPSEWRKRLTLLAARNISEWDVKHWAWIVEAESGDEMISRFISSDIQKPPFLLLMMLGRDKIIKEQRKFVSLLQYILEKYVRPTTSQGVQAPPNNHPPPLMGRQNMTPFHFGILVQRLIYHCRRLWPAALVSVAHLVAHYIETIPLASPGTELHSRGYISRNRVYNQALELFQRRSLHKPLENMSYNWQAQRLLLTLGNKVEPRLLMNKASLRAVRTVFMGLKKTDDERRNAQRSSKTWPPYRKVWDGIDERRKPEDNLSRSVKVGIELQQAGYAAEDIDRAAGALGGALLGQSPTIQTRSLAPREWTGDKAALNVYSAWAARVRSTRNPQEAWKMFNAPPAHGLKPNFQVYAEMFEKLAANRVGDNSSQVPGDSREVWTPYTANLSEFEIIRLEPPSIDELYDRMIHEGNRPVGRCLLLLIRSARTVVQGWGYLQESPFKGHVKGMLDMTSTSSLEWTKRVPPSVLNAWIHLLCNAPYNTAMTQTWGTKQRMRQQGLQLRHALRIVMFLLRDSPRRNKDNRTSAHVVLHALASSRSLYSDRGTSHKHAETLKAFLDVLRLSRAAAGTDLAMLEYLCLMLRKTMKALTIGTGRDSVDEQVKALVKTAHSELVSIFDELFPLEQAEVGEAPNRSLFSFRNKLTSRLLYRYLRVMVACGGPRQIARALEFTLATWDDEAFFVTAGTANGGDFKVTDDFLLSYIVGVGERGGIPADVMDDFRNGLERLTPRTMTVRGEQVEYKWAWPEVSVDDRADIDTDLAIATKWASSL